MEVEIDSPTAGDLAGRYTVRWPLLYFARGVQPWGSERGKG